MSIVEKFGLIVASKSAFAKGISNFFIHFFCVLVFCSLYFNKLFKCVRICLHMQIDFAEKVKKKKKLKQTTKLDIVNSE